MSVLGREIIEIDESLSLEQLQFEDAERLFKLTDKDRERLSEFLPWPKHTKTADDSREFIKLMLQKRKDKQEYGYGIKYNGEVAGHISLMHLDDDKRPEIGYWIASEYSGKGITTQSTKALSDFALRELHIPEVIIRAVPENMASNKVAEKAGYTLDGQEVGEDGKTLNVWSIAL